MRILFFSGSLRMGGAERVISRLANYWAEQGHDVCIATMREIESDFYDLHPKVQRISFNMNKANRNKLQRWYRYYLSCRRTLSAIRAFRPDSVLSFMTGMNFRVLAVRPLFKAPLIISERTNPNKQVINDRGQRIRRRIYRFADRIVFVSEGVADAYPWLEEAKKKVIYNPAMNLPDAQEDRVGEKTIVTLGRLRPVKGHDMLIEAFDRIAGKHPDWRLRIYGEGDFRPALEAQIAASRNKDRIILEGFTRTPEVCMRPAGIFVLSSRYEGFPNALVEAMSMGLPCISFNCHFGPSELIEDHRNGLLVEAENVDKLAEALDYMIENPEQRAVMGREASRIREKLKLETIAGEWERLMHDVSRERS